MSIAEKSKELVETIEEKVEQGLDVVKETLGNVARHLPLTNFAQHSRDSFDLEIDLAGVKKEDIELKIEDDYLTINAIRKAKHEVDEEDYYLYESNIGLISRSFILPKKIDRDKISARFEDGRLYVSLEKEQSQKVKSIKIK